MGDVIKSYKDQLAKAFSDANARMDNVGNDTFADFNNVQSENSEVEEKWSKKYKDSIDCNNPKGFSQKAHCQGRKKEENKEATGSGSAGGYSMPLFGDMKKEETKESSEDLFEGENTPTNPSLWSRAKSMAKSKFDVYPSAYANGWAAKWYKSKGGGWKKKTKKESVESDEVMNEDLRRWFKEKWVDVSKKVDGKHPPCGRKDADGKSYPKCRPSKKVSSETPKVASSYDKDEKKAMTQQKRRAEKKNPKVGKGNEPTMTKFDKKKVETKEATGSSSSGSYVTPAAWAKSTKKKDWRGASKPLIPGGKFVQVKKKCKTFPYCNQGDIKSLKIWENEMVKGVIEKVSKEHNINENIIKRVIIQEIINSKNK
jgi:hypothetical protein